MGLLDSILGSIRMDEPVPGTAQVVSVSHYDGDATYQNARMDLVVQAEGVPATHVQHHALVAAAKWPSPGQVLPVTVDRANPQRLKIDWDQIEDSGTQAARSAEALAAQLRGEGGQGATGMGALFGGATVINVSGREPTEEQKAKLRMLGIDPSRIGGTTAPGQAASGAPPPPEDDIVEQLSKLADLHTSGVLTDAEFAAAKTRVLQGL